MTISTLVDTYRVRLAGLHTLVTIQVWRDDDGWLSVSTSHAIQAPHQAGVYPISPTEYQQHLTPNALARWVADHMEAEVRTAMEAGHTPDESWLVSA